MAETNTASISVIIPNWNGRKWLQACLDSLRRQSLLPAETILVDDGSTDDSVDFVRRNYPEVQVIALPDNRGFCQTANVGIRWAKEESLLLLNNDAQLHPECIEVLSGALEKFSRVDFFALSIVSAEGKTVESAGAAIGREGRFFQRGQGFAVESSEVQADASQPVFGNSGGGGLYRRRLFEDIGLFDEDFQMYHEDQDFNLRAQLRGHICQYLPQAIVYHMGSASLGRDKPQTVELLVRNQLLALAKNLPWGVWLRCLPRIVGAQIRTAAFYAGRGQGAVFTRAATQVLRRIFSIVKKRGPIQARRLISNSDLRRLMEP